MFEFLAHVLDSFLREVRLLLESHNAHDITISYVLNGGEEK